jgi:hypothetical protein
VLFCFILHLGDLCLSVTRYALLVCERVLEKAYDLHIHIFHVHACRPTSALRPKSGGTSRALSRWSTVSPSHLRSTDSTQRLSWRIYWKVRHAVSKVPRSPWSSLWIGWLRRPTLSAWSLPLAPQMTPITSPLAVSNYQVECKNKRANNQATRAKGAKSSARHWRALHICSCGCAAHMCALTMLVSCDGQQN